MIDKLLQVFSNYTRSLEILYLLNDVKKSARMDANEIELKKIREFCDNEGMHLEISNFKVIKAADEGKGGYANIVKKVPLSHPGDGLRHIYISKDKNRAKFLSLLENKDDDKAVGTLLGYPQCCIDFFIKNKEKQQKLQNDYVLPALNNTEGFKFPFYANYAIRYFDVTLLSHFPHSFNCRESIKIAKKNLACMKKYSGELAERFEETLKSPVLYTENSGVFLFKGYSFDGNILEFNEVKSTIGNELFDLLNKNKRLEIDDKNKIMIGDGAIENAGFMLFS